MQAEQREPPSDTSISAGLHAAVQQVRNNGYVLLEQKLPADFLADLRAAFAPLFEAHLAKTGPNFQGGLGAVNHYNMYLPFVAPFSDERLVANPLVLPILDALLGPECVCHYFASNVAMPNSTYQQVHADIIPLFPEIPSVLPPYSIVLNVPLVDFHQGNGPLEVWPGGTHHHVARGADIPVLAARMHFERILMPAGSILIRDSRMWHRGTPNLSNDPRPNLALVYSREWLKLKRPQIEISASAYQRLSERGRKLFRLEKIEENPTTTGTA